MQSEVMGKTLAMFMVIAMIATGIALLPAGTAASGYTITGHLIDDVTGDDVSGVKITIVNTTLLIDKNTTSASDGTFTLYVAERGDFNMAFEKDTYKTINDEVLLNATFNETAIPPGADMGIVLIEPLPTIAGTLKELESKAPISNVEVTIKDGDTGYVIEQIMTDSIGKFSHPVGNTTVNLYYKIDGYYDNSDEGVVMVTYGETNVGDVYLEKITPEPSITVWGIVFEEGTDTTLPGALVSISEGEDKWITAVSDNQGYYEMLAYPGSFQIMASLSGYFTDDNNGEFITVPADKSARQDMYLDDVGGIDYNITVNVNNVMDDAKVYLHSIDGRYTTCDVEGTSGNYSLGYYDSTFRLEVVAEGYFTDVSITITAADNATIFYVTLDKIIPDHKLSGFVFDTEDDSVIEGASVTIYSKNELYTNTKVTAENGYYEFMVHNASDFTVVFDADGFQSEVKNADSIDADRYLEIGLYPSQTDIIHKTYTFVDWNTIQVATYKTLNVDNITARIDADRKWGMGTLGFDLAGVGNLVAGEVAKWATYLEQKGAEQRDTEDFLTLDNLYYELGNSTYTVTIEGAEGIITAANSTIYINGTYNYTLVGELEDADADTFQLNFNSTYDNMYEDFVYDIYIPNYEMTENITETNNVEVTGYNNPITIDPAIFDEDFEEIKMTLERSMNGTAMASIVSGDYYYVVNSTYDNYTVIVAQGGSGGFDTTVKFSAEDSTDLIGDINKANFTWNFGDGTIDWGINVEHNFTNVSGEITVTLKIIETGGNETVRDLFVKVDSEVPSAAISVITTDAENVSVASGVLTVNEDTLLTFSGVYFNDAEGMGDQVIAGGASADEIEDGDGNKGTIEKWFWSWGEDDAPDETITMDGSNNITHAYTEPGTYYLNLITTDVVGHESATANWTVKVIDMTAPVPEFKIVDNGTTVIEVVEDIEYVYNASLSTDNIDDVANMTFVWIFEIDDEEFNYTGEIINFTFSQVGAFNVTLYATDSAGNEANNTQIVNVNLGERPNVLMRVGSMVFDPEDGTAGSAMTISVNLTNDGEVEATNIQVTFYIKDDDGDTEIGTTTISTLAVDEEIEASITWTPGKKGSYSIWANATCAGEHDSQYWDNSVIDFSTQTVTIAEAGWVVPAIVMGIIAVVVVVFFGFRYFMQRGIESDKSGEKKKKK